uniref:Rieske domain-containing protein n=1 Tax=Parastrongyloides trichosuri TaxID=131310 RepID=A0A0N5A0B7_PARTI
MGEELVAFRDKSGQIGLLHAHCAHRGASLEYGAIQEKGIMCCYHGMVFDVDGTCLHVPYPKGEEAEGEKYACSIRQGAYKAFERHGLIFAYMGPPDAEPPFPEWEENFTVMPGDELVAFSNFQHCNWLQVQDNAADNFHPTALHAAKNVVGGNYQGTTFDEPGLRGCASCQQGQSVYPCSAPGPAQSEPACLHLRRRCPAKVFQPLSHRALDRSRGRPEQQDDWLARHGAGCHAPSRALWTIQAGRSATHPVRPPCPSQLQGMPTGTRRLRGHHQPAPDCRPCSGEPDQVRRRAVHVPQDVARCLAWLQPCRDPRRLCPMAERLWWRPQQLLLGQCPGDSRVRGFGPGSRTPPTCHARNRAHPDLGRQSERLGARGFRQTEHAGTSTIAQR